MSPLRALPRTASPILSALRTRALTRTHPSQLQQLRFASHTGTVSSKSGAKVDWGYQWKRVGGVAMMYFPVVAVVMFWPYAVEPIMEVVERNW